MNGFLNINKPPALTSHDVVARLRRVLPATRIGHTGTLDPIATGVLPLCLGRATKVAQLIVATDKGYRVTMRLGEATDTLDASGRVLQRTDGARLAGITAEGVAKAVEGFQGTILQLPPMYSAIKVGGRRLYQAARAGEDVPRESRPVVIHRIEIRALELGPDGGRVVMEVACSKGTYIRTLCADIGARLGVDAHMAALERRRSGPFRIEDALDLDAACDLARAGQLQSRVLAVEVVLAEHKGIEVSSEGERRIQHGRPLGREMLRRWPKDFTTGDRVLVYNPAGQLIALAQALIDDQAVAAAGADVAMFKPERVLA